MRFIVPVRRERVWWLKREVMVLFVELMLVSPSIVAVSQVHEGRHGTWQWATHHGAMVQMGRLVSNVKKYYHNVIH